MSPPNIFFVSVSATYAQAGWPPWRPEGEGHISFPSILFSSVLVSYCPCPGWMAAMAARRRRPDTPCIVMQYTAAEAPCRMAAMAA